MRPTDATRLKGVPGNEGRNKAWKQALLRPSHRQPRQIHLGAWPAGTPQANHPRPEDLIDETLPKESDLSVYTQEQFDAIASHHNAKPRKSLGWKSPAKRSLLEGSFDFQACRPTIINPAALGTWDLGLGT